MPEIREMIVNGYAYPTISEASLMWWLPRLTWVSSFSYSFDADGTLKELDDERVIEQAGASGVGTLMVLAPIGENGSFDSSLAVDLFEHPTGVGRLIDHIVDTIIEKGLQGIDFDIEYLPGKYAADYVNLVRRTRERLAPLGYVTTVALAPKVEDNQPGLLYEGHDYAAMGEVADYCLLMTYEWGYLYGPPMAVSPLDRVREVVEYAVSRIPAGKILLGMSNYGYDWKLPFSEGDRAQTLTNYQAAARAEYYGVPIQFDEVAMSPFFVYQSPAGAEHIVWFENEQSWRARLALVEEYGLAGVGIWNIMSIFYGGI